MPNWKSDAKEKLEKQKHLILDLSKFGDQYEFEPTPQDWVGAVEVDDESEAEKKKRAAYAPLLSALQKP